MAIPDARSRIGLAVAAGLLVALAPRGPARAEEPVDYASQVKPILKERCYACHGALKRQGGLRLDTGASIRAGGDGGPAVEAGHADWSLLVDRVTDADPEFRMPPEGAPLTDEQLAALRAWIDQGAASPAEESPEPDPRRHWAFRPPVRPEVPAVRNAAWVRNPIDAFLAREHEAHGLEPLPPAEPNVLLRRLYLDLTGLPPTRDELREFLADPSDVAYERIVDRLLASPRYGERWARHWMDVWRYSDWYGRRAVPDVLNSYAMIWRWRDWIVRSLNEDRGYDAMVRSMLAADELTPTDEAELVATGFLVRNFYRWNYNSWMKDNVEHVGKAFLGLTINCAHCHDHKYDPISHEDYFAFRAVFEPIELRHDRVPGEPDPGPYPDYDYGKAYGPITSGLVRVFDRKLDAETFLYTRGESRNVVPGRAPIPPGVPRFLGGESFHVEPIELPTDSAYPGLKAFVRGDEIAAREAAMGELTRALDAARERAEVAAGALAAAEARDVTDTPRAFADRLDGTPAFAVEGVVDPELTAARTAAEAARRDLAVAEAEQVHARAELAAIHARIAADDARFGRVGGDAGALAIAAARAERQAKAAQTAALLVRAGRDVFLARAQPAEERAKAESAREAARQAHEAALAAAGDVTDSYSPLGPSYPSQSTGRRAALARWISGRDNPLTARVAVNHIWRWHFGSPLVASTADFGRNGTSPTLPDLLDWLAVELMEPSTSDAEPWSMKALHRLIVTGAAYRMSSHPGADFHPGRSVDPENRRLWRFPTGRMEAEVVRDSLLHLAGRLDPTLGGPDIDFAEGLTCPRRSLYFTHHGEGRMPFLELFDAPDACDAYRRTTSVIPQQALALVNNELLLALSRDLADRLGNEAPEAEFLTAAFEQVLARPPTPAERELAARFLARQAELIGGGPGASADDDDAPARARRDLIHALFSHHDFLTIH